jgi:integrase
MVTAEENLSKFLNRIKSNEKIISSNKKKILDFVGSRKAHNNSPNTIIKYLYSLYTMNVNGLIKKDFSKLTKEEIQEIVGKINNEEWGAGTKKSFRVSLKVFYRWLEGEENFAPNEYPDRVKFIISTIPKRERKELSFVDIVTREEVIRMAQKALNPMHKALLWVSFESGGRPEEILNLRRSDVKFDNYGAIVFLKGVKSKRPVRLVSATEPLRDWLRKHPSSEENDFDIWVTQFSKRKNNNEKWTKLADSGANKMLKVLSERSNLKKRLTMYSLRRGRATELATNPNIARSILHNIMGWEEGSSISRSYVKLSMRDVDEAMLKASGIEIIKKQIPSFIECSFCRTKNSPDSLYCQNPECDKPLVLGDIRKGRTQAIDEKKIGNIVKEEVEKAMKQLVENNFIAQKEVDSDSVISNLLSKSSATATAKIKTLRRIKNVKEPKINFSSPEYRKIFEKER